MTIEKSETKCKLDDEEIKAFNIVYGVLDNLFSETYDDDIITANDNQYERSDLILVSDIINDIRQSKDLTITIDRG